MVRLKLGELATGTFYPLFALAGATGGSQFWYHWE